MCKIQVADGRFPGIYKITESSTGKVYIGQTSRTIDERLTQHVMHPAKGSAIDEAIQKKGENAFVFEAIAPMKDPTTEQLWFQEYYFISKFKSWDEKHGFNQTRGNRGAEFKNFEVAFMRDFICVDDDLFKFIMKTYRLDFSGKRVLLINNFSESIKNYLEFQTGKENVDIIYESFDIEDKKELGEVLGEYIKSQIKYRAAEKTRTDSLAGEQVMEQPNVYYDIIIANPPYGKVGNEITQCIIDNLEWGVYVNLMPANDYRRFNKGNKLYQFVDIRSMKPVIDGFADAAVTTHMALINKERSMYLGEDEFEIENYIDKSLIKYFYGNRQKSHYAIDTNFAYLRIDRAETLTPETSFIIGVRDISHGHMPYSRTNMQYKWNVEKSVDAAYLIANQGKHRSNKYDKEAINGLTVNSIEFKTPKEKENFSNFVYSEEGFRFISKVFTAVNCDGLVKEGKVFPKVSWERKWTVEELLREYEYTEQEIQEVMDDLKNFKGMDNE